MSTPKAINKLVPEVRKLVKRDEKKAHKPKSRRVSLDDRLADIETSDRQASLAYLRARYSPDESPPARIPDLMRFPSAVTKTRTNFRFKTVPNTSAGAPAFSGLMFVFPGLRTKAVHATGWTALTGKASGRTVVIDPIYGESGESGPVKSTMWLAFRPVAMCVRLENTTALLNRSGSTKFCLLPTAEGAIGGAPSMTDTRFDYLDPSPAVPLDNATVALEQKYIWSPMSLTEDMSYTLIDVDNFGPYLAFQSDSENAQTFNVIVDTLYEYLPSRSYRQLVDVRASEGSMEMVDDIEAVAANMVQSQSELKRAADGPQHVTGFFDSMAGAVDELITGVGEYLPPPVAPLVHGLRSMLFETDPAERLAAKLRAASLTTAASPDYDRSDDDTGTPVVVKTGRR